MNNKFKLIKIHIQFKSHIYNMYNFTQYTYTHTPNYYQFIPKTQPSFSANKTRNREQNKSVMRPANVTTMFHQSKKNKHLCDYENSLIIKLVKFKYYYN